MAELYCDPAKLRQERGRPLVFGHRGLPGGDVENRLAAFAAAIAAGADGVEFDVQIAADGVPVVIHDSTLDRTTGRPGRVAASGSARLASLGIPLLEMVLDQIPAPALLNVELKDFRPMDHGLERAVLALVFDRQAQARVLVSSFNPWALARVRRSAPGLYTAQLTSPATPAALRLGLRFGSPGIHPHIREVSREVLQGWRNRNRRLIVWGDRNETELALGLGMEVDGIITDRPAEAVRMLQQA